MSKKNYMLLGIIFVIAIFLPGYIRLRELRYKHIALLEEIERVKQENKKLAHQVELLESDPFYIEKTARDRMGVGREGEIRYKIVYEDDTHTDKSDD